MAEATTEDLDPQSDVDEPDEDLATVDDEAEPRPARRWLIWVAVLVVLLSGALAAGALLIDPVLGFRAETARRATILAVATDVAQRSYALDFRSFPQQGAAIIAESAGSYRQGLISSESGLQYILSQGQVKSTCTITAAGIERDDANTATVLFAITSSVTNTQVHTPQVRYYRVAMNLVRRAPTGSSRRTT